ncbi:MAG: DUF3368 domain-containing protein [Bacteroidales bacterium]|nr:DUF3368 domain-containing protein [Bacteroidales bacterium]
MTFTGTMGILIIAKQKGLIKSPTEIITDVQKTDFGLSDSVVNEHPEPGNETYPKTLSIFLTFVFDLPSSFFDLRSSFFLLFYLPQICI